MTGRKRAAKGRRWSAGSTVERYDTGGNKLAEDDTSTQPSKVVVRWRCDGKGRHRTFKGADVDGVDEFRALLAAAYAGNWDATDTGRPVLPPLLPTAATAPPDPDTSPADLPLPLPTPPVLPVNSGPQDVAELASWFKTRQQSRPTKRGTNRKAKTLDNYFADLDLAVTLLRYEYGDRRLVDCEREAGDSLLLDDVDPADLIRALDTRAATNLRTRATNRRRLERWAKEVRKSERVAARTGQPLEVPPAPMLDSERASARAIEAFAQQTKAMFTVAAAHRLISVSPWTAAVDDATIRPQPIHYTSRNVLNRNQIERVADAITTRTRSSRTPEQEPVTIDGGRYRAMVVLAGVDGPRPEEVRALRLSWIEDHPHQPLRIGFRGGEVDQPKKLTGASQARTATELKHRLVDEIRWVDLDPWVEAELRTHIANFVPEPDPTSTDEELRDPHVFTTHWGAVVDLSNFAEKWWKPALATVFDNPTESQFVSYEFRQLRAAAITGWLKDGYTLAEAAAKAGNSQAVIEKHYAGVLAEVGYQEQQRKRRQSPNLAELDDVTLTAVRAEATELLRRRLAETG